MELKKLYPSTESSNSGGGTGSGFQPKDMQTEDFICEANSAYPIDSSLSTINATLPATSLINNGDRIQFFDGVGSSNFFNPSGFGKNKLIIHPNSGQTILGYNDSFEIEHDNETITLTFYGNRWSISGGVKTQQG